MERYTKEKAILMLREMARQLAEKGKTRFPKRSDFSDEEVNAIKAFLGSWPRALETAGLKEKRTDDRLEKNRAKRIAAKKRRREAEKARKKETNEQKENETV